MSLEVSWKAVTHHELSANRNSCRWTTSIDLRKEKREKLKICPENKGKQSFSADKIFSHLSKVQQYFQTCAKLSQQDFSSMSAFWFREKLHSPLLYYVLCMTADWLGSPWNATVRVFATRSQLKISKIWKMITNPISKAICLTSKS